MRREARIIQSGGDYCADAAGCELCGRQVYCNAEMLWPSCSGAASLVQRPRPDFIDEAHPLRNRNELSRRDKCPILFRQADQRLEADEAASHDLEQRFIVQLEAIMKDRISDRLFELYSYL